ncbi:MAG: DUF4339 domain-containing protein [Myxococcales bacterium]|nr:DUF4339 domain-containing protein [Myxococcales bacterium]
MSEEGTDFWFCANPDGSLKTVDRDELLSGLKQGSLNGKSLVWRQGWAEWVAAGQVAELSTALPTFARGAIIVPKPDPDRISHPPPIPVNVSPALEPIVPVASTPENDRPGTLVMQEVELTGSDLLAVQPPPPSRASAPPAPSRRGTPPPRPGAPPAAAWVEVAPLAKPAPPDKTVSELSKPKAAEPIVPVDSNPHHEPVTGTLGDEEIQILEVAAGTRPAPKADKPLASAPSLDGLAAMVEAKRPKPAPMIAISRPAPVQPAAPAVAPVISPMPDPESDAPTHMADAIVPVSEPENEAPTQIHPAALRPDAEPLPAFAIDAAPAPLPAPPEPTAWQTPMAPAAAPSYAPPPAAAYPSYAPPKKKSALPWVVAGLGVFGLFGALAAGAAFYFKPWESAAAPTAAAKASAATTSTAQPPAKATPSITVSKASTSLSPAIQLSVPPYVATRGGKVAVGFATAETSGLGIMVDLESLAVEQAFTAPAGKKLIGVVPVASESGRFVADRDGGPLGLPHTVEAEPAFTLGFTPKGYVRQPKAGAVEELWSDVTNDKATEARVASVDGVGHVVTFRSGGKVRVGWVKPNGSKKSDLASVDVAGRAGTPTVAAGDAAVLVAFAAKTGDDAHWSVHLATSKHGETPSAAKAFSVPTGGPGGDAIAPVAAGLPEGRWLLQWTEGGAGERVVRVQVLDKDLSPLGDASTVSAPGKEAGQGVVVTAGSKALSLQLVKGDKGYELWGTALSIK